ncbi:hypothetical protein C8046_11825 [Serinibacter arcticus]|uniref:DUF4097 domain-containing protein n=1 Tax=Serinibacter arcticus TaxID=1655435 RepID=A0A2U1ZWC4_9MICO|nr:DUF4097 family beta strand repeat-containing protein [Serinibacter arcticus]PWD51240.1 hypothetical protein C8046_11825 [Serinibacter arcticus]
MTAPENTRTIDVEVTGPFGIRGSLNQAEARIVAVEGLTVAHVELVATSKRGADLLDDAMTLTPEGLEIRLPTMSEAIAAQGLWRGLASGASWGLRVEARVPAGSWLDLRSKVASLKTEGRFGSVRWASSLGDVTLERTEFLSADIGMGNLKVGYCDAAEITGGAGDVKITEVGGSLTIDGGVGDVRVRTLRGTAAIVTGLGDVTLGEVSASGGTANDDGGREAADVRVTCTAGDIKIKELVTGSVRLGTTMGDVTVGVARGSDLVGADLRSESGSARCKVPVVPGPRLSGPLDVPLAWGTPTPGVHIHAESSSGDITVRDSRRGKRDRT